MCKHVAATFYGIGARLDAEPELLFSLRQVDAKELVAQAGEGGPLVRKTPGVSRILDSSRLADVFGIDIDIAVGPGTKASPSRASARTGKKASVPKLTSPKRKAPR